MPKRIYVGSADAVEVLLPDGQIATVKRGESFEFPDEMVKEMDVSAAWSTSTSAGKSADTTQKEQ
jgi:hypothetical protein